jgi:hypothetical protein
LNNPDKELRERERAREREREKEREGERERERADPSIHPSEDERIFFLVVSPLSSLPPLSACCSFMPNVRIEERRGRQPESFEHESVFLLGSVRPFRVLLSYV